MEKINVMLYGGFDMKSKNRAEIVMCDRCDKCSLYKKNQCLSVTAAFSDHCKFGKVNKIQGYTQRAMKRYGFDEKYKKDECYGKLSHPTDWRVAILDDVIVFNLIFAICDKERWNNWEHKWEELDHYNVRECGFRTGTYSYIPLEELTSEVLNKILSYIPRTMMGYDEIKDYQKKIVPNILFELSKLLPDVYEKLITDYPKYKKISPNFIGKKALIKSLADGIILKDRGGIFVKDSDYLVSECWVSSFLPFRSKQAEVRIKITDDMYYEITDNSQVDENTEFK